MTEYQQDKFNSKVIEHHSNDIELLGNFRTIIDQKFEDTRIFFMAELAAYVASIVIPMITMSIAARDSEKANVSRIVYNIATFINLLLEVGNMKKQAVAYFYDSTNIFDLLQIILSIPYFIMRTNNQVEDSETVLVVILFVCIMAKIQNLVKFNKILGALSQLIVLSFIEVLPFLFFLFIWTLFFEMMYHVLGVYHAQFDADGDFPMLDKVYGLFYISFGNSVGDFRAPSFMEDTTLTTKVLIYSVYLVQMILNNIILLNFVIALIS